MDLNDLLFSGTRTSDEARNGVAADVLARPLRTPGELGPGHPHVHIPGPRQPVDEVTARAN